MFELLAEMRQLLLNEHKPDGFNIGINDGTAAGQTVMHLHIHLIPRYSGDTEDPRGGVRWIMPEKAPYWKKQ
jgi:diadenosine tetraphosphate (Ap4A) HIT family hydrolase